MTALISMILLLVALLGMGFGIWAVVTAMSLPTREGQGTGLLAALTFGGIPFIAGTVALAGAGVMFSTEQVRDELEIARADRETMAAREIAHAREERRNTPEFQAQVEAVKSERKNG